MNIDVAETEVRKLGEAYFYDDLDRFSVEEIISRIRSEITQTFKISGLKYSEITRDALLMVLKEYDVEQLDRILDRDFALLPDEVNGSYNFLNGLAKMMSQEIETTRRKLQQKTNGCNDIQ